MKNKVKSNIKINEKKIGNALLKENQILNQKLKCEQESIKQYGKIVKKSKKELEDYKKKVEGVVNQWDNELRDRDDPCYYDDVDIEELKQKLKEKTS